MTSKEALQKILLSLYIPTRDVRDINKDVECIDIIAKDLEVLEIIKRHYKNLNGFNEMIPEYTDDYEQDIKDFCKLEEWLKND